MLIGGLRWYLIALILSLLLLNVVVRADESFDERLFIVDAHVHTAGIGIGNSGCFVSKELRDGYKFEWYLSAFGVTLEELETHGDKLILERLSKQIEASEMVDKAVVLAMDGILTADKELDVEKTQIYIPNEFIAAETAKHDNLVFGASVNPYRLDAVERLHQVKSQGAVLVKWIPAIMGIDPNDPALKTFYETLVELKLPLLTHVGQEKSFGHAEDQMGDPKRLTLALETGVVVIAAHIGTTGKNDGEDNYARLLPMFAKFPNLYTDISSLTQLNKLGYLSNALENGTFTDRMIYGSDWPLQFFPLVSPWYHIGRAPIADLWRASRTSNQWDTDVRLKKAIGVPKSVFERSAKLLGVSPTSHRVVHAP